MKKILLFFLMFLMSFSVINAIDTCVSTTDNRSFCFDTDANIMPQNINLFEGQNSKYGLYVENPTDDDLDIYSKFIKNIKGALSTNKINVESLEDDTKFHFDSATDFYNFLQRNNAEGNVSLFTKKDLNQEIREKTQVETNNVLNWTFLLLVVVVEFFKITINTLIILMSIYIYFRLLPFIFNKIKMIVFKIVSNGVK